MVILKEYEQVFFFHKSDENRIRKKDMQILLGCKL